MLGYNYSEYLELTPRSLNNAVAGFSRKQKEGSVEAWERMRQQTAALINIHLPKGKRMEAKALFQFPWDRKQTPQISKEKARKILDKWQSKV